jgi:hypothetical protein
MTTQSVRSDAATGNAPTSDRPSRQTGQSPRIDGRQRRARQIAYLGCAGALGYGVVKLIWALGMNVGLSNPEHYRAALSATTGLTRFFDDWGTPILAGLGVVVLLGLVYPWGNGILRRPLRILAWLGSLIGIVGVAGLVLTIQYLAGALDSDRLGDVSSGTYLFVYLCFTVLGLAFGATAWLTRR